MAAVMVSESKMRVSTTSSHDGSMPVRCATRMRSSSAPAR